MPCLFASINSIAESVRDVKGYLPFLKITPTIIPTEPGWLGAQYAYAGEQAHAVTSVQRGETADTFEYDENGNMITRVEGGVTWTQSFNAENRLASVSNRTDTWTFVYDGDGNRVKQVNPDGKISLFLGGGVYSIVNATGSPEVTKYYSVAGQRVALNGPDGLQYLLTNHLGSVSAVLDGRRALPNLMRCCQPPTVGRHG